MDMSNPPFGLLPAGHPVITTPTEAPSPQSFLYSIPPSSKPIGHIAVFLVPGITLPENTAAAVYLVTPPAPGTSAPSTRFLGGIGSGKESAIFKLSSTPSSSSENTVIGISVEDGASVAQRIEELKAASGSGGGSGGGTSTALVPAGEAGKATTLVLAQRIGENLFNYLSSFTVGGAPGQGEVVPMKVIQAWWTKFEGRVKSDPAFLERI